MYKSNNVQNLLKCILSWFTCLLVACNLYSQMEGYTPKIIPIPPSTFQFIKYGEIPVSEYTGVPNITIPIYTIKDGDLTLPLSLNYHAGGIRVAEEASWVGLGWNLDVGNVAQIVNDRDDLSTQYQKLLPDYYLYYYPFEFIWRFNYPFTGTPVPSGFAPSTGISQTHPGHSWTIFTDFYIPLNGTYDTRSPQLFNAQGTGNDNIDSEPDVFKASFCGHSVEFIIDFASGIINILNNKGYKVEKSLNTSGQVVWKIIVPDGKQYYFEEINEVYKDYSITNIDGTLGQNLEHNLLSRIWHLTKIIDNNTRSIRLHWNQVSNVSDISNFSQKFMYKTRSDMYSATLCGGINYKVNSVDKDGYGNEPASSTATATSDSWSFSGSMNMVKSYLSSIGSSTDSIVFIKSGRLDINNDIKLDEIDVYNKLYHLIKQFYLSYDYFVGDNSGGSSDKSWGTYYSNKSSTELLNRLKLTSFQESGIPSYQFRYDGTTLPIKTSYAVDYWGFFNGKTSNTSLVPNPAHLSHSNWGNNGNDRNANLIYSKAGTLNQIIYPTGGITNFEYESNTFTHSIYDTISYGYGLRIKTTTDLVGAAIALKTNYTYDGGLTMVQQKFTGQYGFNRCYGTNYGGQYSCTVKYIASNNSYISSLLGSGNFVGYSKVTSKKTDTQGNNLGTTISYYSNQPDIDHYEENTGMSLPARKNEYYVDNGLLVKQEIFNNNGQMLLQKLNYYSYYISNVFYGAKEQFYNLLVVTSLSGGGTCVPLVYHQDLVGYYPLYKGFSLLDSAITISFDGGLGIRKKNWYFYNNYNLMLQSNSNTSDGSVVRTYYTYPDEAGVTELVNANRLSEVIKTEDFKNSVSLKKVIKSFKTTNGLILPYNISEAERPYQYTNGSLVTDNLIIYDQYGNKGEILQYTMRNKIPTSFIWGYNQTYPMAKIEGKAYTDIAESIRTAVGSHTFTGGTSYTDINTDMAWLKTQLFSLLNDKTCMVTFYTYAPLIGLTSSTDPNGVTTYYEYDTFGRLKCIKDDDGRILKTYEYNYQH